MIAERRSESLLQFQYNFVFEHDGFVICIAERRCKQRAADREWGLQPALQAESRVARAGICGDGFEAGCVCAARPAAAGILLAVMVNGHYMYFSEYSSTIWFGHCYVQFTHEFNTPCLHLPEWSASGSRATALHVTHRLLEQMRRRAIRPRCC